MSLFNQAVALRDLLSNKARWLKGVTSTGKNGMEVPPTSPAACKFCLIGGIAHVARINGSAGTCWPGAARWPLGQLVGSVIKGMSDKSCSTPVRCSTIYDYNDFQSHENLMEVLDTAVEFARGAA